MQYVRTWAPLDVVFVIFFVNIVNSVAYSKLVPQEVNILILVDGIKRILQEYFFREMNANKRSKSISEKTTEHTHILRYIVYKKDICK